MVNVAVVILLSVLSVCATRGADDIIDTPNLNSRSKVFVPEHRVGLESLVIGGSCGALEAFVNHPLWAWKTRQQYGDPFTLNPKLIYRGVVPNMVSMAGIISIRMSVRDYLMTVFDKPTFLTCGVSAFSGGLASSFLTSYIELGMTQQQKLKEKTNFFKVHKMVYEKYGLSRNLTGTPWVGMRDGWFSFGFMALTPYVKAKLREITPSNNDIALSMAAGIFSGSFSAFVSHPFDTIKSIQHANAMSSNAEDVSFLNIGKRILKEEGVVGFYKGFLWRWARVASGITLLAYSNEFLTNFIHEK